MYILYTVAYNICVECKIKLIIKAAWNLAIMLKYVDINYTYVYAAYS